MLGLNYCNWNLSDEERSDRNEELFCDLHYGIRFYKFLGETAEGNYLGDPPNETVDLCHDCYETMLHGDLQDFRPTNPDQAELLDQSFDAWEWDSVCTVFSDFGEYHCDECKEAPMHIEAWLDEKGNATAPDNAPRRPERIREYQYTAYEMGEK